ncbi:hypothetical protein KV557_10130 [Kitasatospora aureofaciens]|uniref:hypothetical protein n=1 Tax=Kitasatospora aureofaciens TaxID=1894 RepID=UPI001C477952|nr:hypothetical protein [Kitasatospora aureofaciens]MBV6697482.1 hypothetical protein [Kitasatospora aureofaciens]
MTDFPIPTGPIDTPPRGFRPAQDNETALRAALTTAGVQLGTYDEQIITWLASWEWATVAPIAGWITRANTEETTR